MTVNKVNGFAAPYRSATFQAQANAQVGRSGVLSMAGPVTAAGGTLTIPPFSFIQNGLITTKDIATSVVLPALSGPYHLVVTAPTPNQTEDLIFAFTVAPADVTTLDTVLASFDGLEWHQVEPVSIDGLIQAGQRAHVAFGDVGPSLGLQTTVSGSNYVNSPGALFDTEGSREVFTSPAFFPVIAPDPNFARVDKIVYRRPLDSPLRIGRREFLGGGTYAATPSVAAPQAGIFDSSVPRANITAVIARDNSALVFAASGYGGSYQLSFTKLSSDRLTVTQTPVTLLTMNDQAFSVAVDDSGNIHTAYTAASQIFYQKFSPTGTPLVSALRLDSGATPSKKPFLVIDPQQSRVFVAYQTLLGPSNYQLFLTSLNLSGSVVTSSARLLSTATNLENIALAVSADLHLYAAFEDSVNAQVFTQTYDDIGTPLSAPVLISGATQRLGYGTLVNHATSAQIAISDTGDLFVTFLQDKGGNVFGLSVWTAGAAFMQALTSTSEAITRYAFELDQTTNALHLLVARAASIDYVKLEQTAVSFTLNIGTFGTSSLSTKRDRLGSMFHAWTATGASTFSTYQTGIHLIAIGAATLAGSIAPVTLTASQFLVRSAGFTGRTPAPGDQVTITGSAISGDNATKTITLSELVSQNAGSDSYRITVDTAFVAPESPSPNGLSAYAAPVGNAASAVKSTSELQTLAYRLDTLPSDILLTRVGTPGGYVLNWLKGGRPTLDSDCYLVHGTHIALDYAKTVAGDITITGGLKILDMVHNVDYTLIDGSYAVAEGSALYVTLDPANQSPTPQVLPVSYLPWSSPIQVIGIVKEGAFSPSILLSSAGVGVLDPGESVIIGENLPISMRQRLGIINETTYEAYPSTLVVSANDTYPEAIGKLDAQVGALEANHPGEDSFTGDGTTAQPFFTTAKAALSWSTDNTIYDIQVWVDGRREELFTGAGAFTSGFRKTGIQSFQLSGLVQVGSVVTVRKEGTSYGGPLPPSPGKLWSDQVDHAIAGPDLAFAVGAAGQRFSAGYFGTLVAQQVSLSLPFGAADQVKAKTNGDVVTLAAGQPVALSANGKVYRAGAGSGLFVVGILMETLTPGAAGRVILCGYNIAGALTGLGFPPGSEVYVDESGNYSSGVSGITAADTYQRVGYADCPDQTASSVATDLIVCFQTIAQAP